MSDGESKFGFKNMEKALETLKLLESHDMQYRKLTVRGLLGRAKRVLSMTKAADKLKNIKDAIGVFEKWLEENGGSAASKNAKTDDDDKVETVPGLGYKDKAAAQATLSILEERDPDYQRLAIKGLIGSSKRVLSGTKDEEKIKAIKEGVQVLEDFLEKFENENRMKDNRAYLAHTLISKFPEPQDELVLEFLNAYGGPKAKGNYKHLRTMYPKGENTSWDIIRNRKIAKLLEKLSSEADKLFDPETGAPTELHLKLIYWAYSPQPDKIKKYAEKLDKKSPGTQKRKLDNSSNSSNSGNSSNSSSDDTKSSSEEEEPVIKKKRNEEEVYF